MSDTPRTDEMVTCEGTVGSDFARQLERELAAALKAKEELCDERLRARTAALEAGYDGGDLAEIIRDLKRAKEEAERDAHRYQWLKKTRSYVQEWGKQTPPRVNLCGFGANGTDLDAAIDEAMKT